MNQEIAFALFCGAVIGFLFGLYTADRQHATDLRFNQICSHLEGMRQELDRVTRYIKH